LPDLYFGTYHRAFDVTDYGVCNIEDLLNGLRNSNFIQVSKIRDETDEYILSLQKRRQTNVEIEKTSIFASEVVELLRNAPQFSILFRKFVRSYHYYFGYQCKLSDYGFLRLAELLEALSGVVEMDSTNEENRKIFLSRKVALRIFSEQIQEIIKTMTGLSGTMVKVDELMEMHKSKYGYQMQGSSLGYESVIDALKFVPFVELHSYENEVWIVAHLENEKFRQRAMLVCLAIIDIGTTVPLSKFHAVFGDKFKFSIPEKQLHAMKHAVQIEMVNGIKMISITPMMKFIMHVVNIVEQHKMMNIQEIKTMMKLNLTTCFNFGFPNLSSLFQAFPDIFSFTKAGLNLHDRSDIELVHDCPLTQSGLQKLLSMNMVQIPDEKPEIFKQVQKPLPIGYNRSQKMAVPRANDTRSQQHIQLNPFCRNYNNQNNSNIHVHSFCNDVTMPTELLGNFAQPNYEEQQQGFYERNLKFQQQQQQQMQHAMKRDYWNNSTGCSSNSSNFSGGNDVSIQQKYSMIPPYFCFDVPESPKLSKPATIWFDPVWKSDSGMFDVNRGSNVGSSASSTTDSVRHHNLHFRSRNDLIS
jgi:meiosis arrest female protein 1